MKKKGNKTMQKNAKLNNVKNDEVYTRLADVENELTKYDPNIFKDKTIYCNCDDPSSNCWIFFHMNFHRLGLKKLIAAHYKMDGSSSYAMMYDGKNPQDDVDFDKGTKIPIKGNGDFRILLKQSDLVVANLPSTLVRVYIAQLEQYTNPYTVIGTSAIICKGMFPLLKDEKTMLWLFTA